MRPIVPLLFLFALPFFAQAQPCVYLAYDPLDYPAGSPLNGQSGSTGWTQPWYVQNADVTLPGYAIGSGSLGFGSLQTLGQHGTGGRAYLTAGRRLHSAEGGPFGAFVATGQEGIGSQTGDTLWMSALLRKDQNNGESVFTGLHGSDLSWCDNCTGQRIEFGYFEGQSDVAGQRRWTLRLGNSFYPTAEPVVLGTAAFFTVRIVFTPTATEVALYHNPTLPGAGGPGAATVLQNTTEPFVLRSVVAYLGNSPGNGALDEVRLAESFACVAPDPTVTVDLPPVAVLAATPDDGMSPLTVTLSSAGSYDPENGALTYAWSFGDGTPGSNLPNPPAHTYTPLGNLTLSLTVTDPGGQSSTAVHTVTVRDENGTFPCQSRFSLVQEASCTANNGHISINASPASFSLRNAGGTVLTPTNGNQFPNLPPGTYQYTALGTDGCTDTFALYVPIDSTTCPGWQPSDCQLAIGTNMSGFADWVPERPMRNLMKHVRYDYIAFDDACFCWSNGNAAGIVTDADGYPTQVPQYFNGVDNKVRYVISSEGANLPPGQAYVLLYDGTGTVAVGGGLSVTSSTPGRIEFNVLVADNLFFIIHASQMGDHVRNIRIVRLADEGADLDAQPFYQGFLDKIAPFSALRFMDWGATNANTVEEWADRSTLTYFTYATPHGVPYEMMVRLANHTKKDVWICVPHAADSNYVAQMAALFRDSLDPSLTIYLEYSNEVWNWIFPQSQYNVANAPSNLGYGAAMAEKAGRTFRIWHSTFGGQSGRVKRVLGLQGGFNYLNEQILSHLPPEDWDFGSPTSYLGLDHSATANPVLHAGSTPQDIILNARNAWAGFRPAVRQDYRNVKLFGKEVINYEGGQHFVGNSFGIPYPYQQAMWDAQYTTEIYDLYDDMLDTIRAWGSGLFGNFSLASAQESVYGSWGVVNDIDVQPPYLSTAPKYQSLLDNLPFADYDFDGHDTLLAVCPGFLAAPDCNDHDPDIHPGAAEVCGNGLDDDCNGLIDAADPGVVPATNTWTGNGDGTLWTDPANWSLGMVPAACHEVVVPPGSNVTVPSGSTGLGNTLQVDTSGELTVPVNGELEIGNE